MKQKNKLRLWTLRLLSLVALYALSPVMAMAEDTLMDFGMNLVESEIDNVVWASSQFLGDETFIGSQGPFWYILQMCMALAGLFTIIMFAGMAFKMIVKHEPVDILKLLRPLAISIVLCWWYPPSITGIGRYSENASVLEMLSLLPNAIGNYTKQLYEAEASQVQDRFEDCQYKLKSLEDGIKEKQATATVSKEGATNTSEEVSANAALDVSEVVSTLLQTNSTYLSSATAGAVFFIDKILIFMALVVWRIGWWGTIYCQQIILGMLTIFGPLQWAFSCLPKWEGAWAKWLIRYLTVHFYGAMIFFVGFYVMLLFDIAINMMYADLSAIMPDGNGEYLTAYIKNSFFTSGYLLAASGVAVRCLTLVPDLAAWMIPEGDTAFSTRSFGEGMGKEAQGYMSRMAGGATRGLTH